MQCFANKIFHKWKKCTVKIFKMLHSIKTHSLTSHYWLSNPKGECSCICIKAPSDCQVKLRLHDWFLRYSKWLEIFLIDFIYMTLSEKLFQVSTNKNSVLSLLDLFSVYQNIIWHSVLFYILLLLWWTPCLM